MSVYVCIYVDMCACTSLCVHVCLCSNMCHWACVYIPVCISVSMHICVSICVEMLEHVCSCWQQLHTQSLKWHMGSLNKGHQSETWVFFARAFPRVSSFSSFLGAHSVCPINVTGYTWETLVYMTRSQVLLPVTRGAVLFGEMAASLPRGTCRLLEACRTVASRWQ